MWKSFRFKSNKLRTESDCFYRYVKSIFNTKTFFSCTICKDVYYIILYVCSFFYFNKYNILRFFRKYCPECRWYFETVLNNLQNVNNVGAKQSKRTFVITNYYLFIYYCNHLKILLLLLLMMMMEIMIVLIMLMMIMMSSITH